MQEILKFSRAFEELDNTHTSILNGAAIFTKLISHSPLDVVAWHGNYAPIVII